MNVLCVQELNAKAENKFNRLKAQAKTKIANLNREVERLRTEKGDTTFNLSAQVKYIPPFTALLRVHLSIFYIVYVWTMVHVLVIIFSLRWQSLDGSMISGGSDRSDVTEQLRSEVTEKEREVACLEEERERLREELAAMKDRLNVAEVNIREEDVTYECSGKIHGL